MRYFPGYCERCQRSFLVESDVPGAAPTCPRCRDAGRLIPGAYYGEGDRSFFAAMETALHDARLAPGQVAALVNLLEAVASHDATTLSELRETLRRISGMHRVERLLTDDTLSPRRVLGLLFSLLGPLASSSGASSGTRALVEIAETPEMGKIERAAK